MSEHGTIVGQAVSTTKLQRAKELRSTMTDAERSLWERLRANQIHGLRFRRQQVLDGFIADFYCHAARLVIEIDGPVHDHQVDYDIERERVLAARGLRILRFTNWQIEHDMGAFLMCISGVCKADGS